MGAAIGRGDATPRVADHVVPLPRVLRVLNQWAPITVVRGARGYGKTTQVVHWLRGLRPAPALLWLDTSDGPWRSALTAWLAAHPPAARPARRSVVVIDDADQLLDEESVDLLLGLLRRRHDLHLVPIARTRTPLDAAADGRVQTTAIPSRELLFDVEEIAALAHRLGVSLTNPQLARLHDELGGWPAAVRIVLDELRAGAPELPITRAERYLRRAVLPDLAASSSARRSMRFALAARLTHRLICDLADDLPAEEAIDVLEGLGHTDIRHLADDVELVLPGFVRRSLSREFTASDPEAARAMHQRLAEWYDTHPGPDHDMHVLAHSRAAGAWPLFESTWARVGTSLAVSHPDDVDEVLRGLPDPVVKRRPSIAVLRMALAAGRADGSPHLRRTLVRAEHARLSAGVTSESMLRMPLLDMLAVGAGRMMALRQRGEFASADALAARVDAALLHRQEAGESAGDALSWYYLQRALNDHLRLRWADASRWYHLSWRHRQRGDVSAGRAAAGGLALVSVMTGRRQDAETWAQRHRALPDGAGGSQPVADTGMAVAAQLSALDRLDPEDNQPLGEISGIADSGDFWAFATLARARRELIFGHPAIGLDIVDRARNDHRDDRSEAAGALLTRASAELLIALGQGHRATQVLGAADIDAEPMLAEPLAWIHLLSGDPASARNVATRALFRDDATMPDRVGLLLIVAIAAGRLGEVPLAREAVEHATALALDTGVAQPFALPHKTALTALLAAVGRELPDWVRERVDALPSAFPETISLVTLTAREKELVVELRSGTSREKIAEQKFVSINTVKKQLVTLYRKLGVTTRADALVRLEELGLLRPGDAPKKHPAKARRRPADPQAARQPEITRGAERRAAASASRDRRPPSASDARESAGALGRGPLRPHPAHGAGGGQPSASGPVR